MKFPNLEASSRTSSRHFNYPADFFSNFEESTTIIYFLRSLSVSVPRALIIKRR